MSRTRESAVDAVDERQVVEIAASGSSAPRQVTVRSLESQEDFEQCETLERDTWGQSIAVPASLLMVSQKVGGVTAGAFDEDGRMVGMVYGLTGPRDGRLVHWSHMLAVRQGLRSLGIGRELKLFQRRLVRRLGVETMLWTYDPLVARNAQLNINRLGARPVEYLEDLYGAESDSHLHQGLGTDRFVVEWPLDEQPAPPRVTVQAWDLAPVVNTSAEGEPLEGEPEMPRVPRVRVEIPVDVQRAKTESEDAGYRWRLCTRRAIEGYFGRGYGVVGFQRHADSDRCFYLLAEGESR